MARPNLPQFDKAYDHYKMRAMVDDLQRWFRTIEQGLDDTGNAIIGEHNDLGGRGEPDAHPISAIDGLESALDDNAANISTLDIRVGVNETAVADHEIRITTLENDAVATFAQRIDDTTSSTIYYFGEAQPGVVDANALWRIQRITFITPGEDDVDIEWADGNSDFDNIWDDRVGLSYS